MNMKTPIRHTAVALMVALSVAACGHSTPKNSASAKPSAKPSATATAQKTADTKSTKDSNLKNKVAGKSSDNLSAVNGPHQAAPALPSPASNGSVANGFAAPKPGSSFASGPAAPTPWFPTPWVNVPGNPFTSTNTTPQVSTASNEQGSGTYAGGSGSSDSVGTPSVSGSTGTVPAVSIPGHSSTNDGVTTDNPTYVPSLPGTPALPGTSTDDPTGVPSITLPGSGNTNPVIPSVDGDTPVLPPLPGGSSDDSPVVPPVVNPGGDNGGVVTPPVTPSRPVSPEMQARINTAQTNLANASAKVVMAQADLNNARNKSSAAKTSLANAQKSLADAKSEQAGAIAALAQAQADLDSTTGMVSARAQYADAAARSRFSKAGEVDWSKVSENDRARITASILAAKINAYRENMGLPALPETNSLHDFAQEWSTKMATGEAGFGHDRARLQGYLGDKADGTRVTNINENVAYVNSTNPVADAEYVFSLWRNSHVHNENMKANDMNAMAIAVKNDSQRGIYATLNMVRYKEGNTGNQTAHFYDVSKVHDNVSWNTNTNEKHYSIEKPVTKTDVSKIDVSNLPKNATSSFTVGDIQKPVLEKDIKDREEAAGITTKEKAVEAADEAVNNAEAKVPEAAEQVKQADAEVTEAEDQLSSAQAGQQEAQKALDDTIAEANSDPEYGTSAAEATAPETVSDKSSEGVSDEVPAAAVDTSESATPEVTERSAAETVAEEVSPTPVAETQDLGSSETAGTFDKAAETPAPVENDVAPAASTEIPVAATSSSDVAPAASGVTTPAQ